jgi:hypothetical protein
MNDLARHWLATTRRHFPDHPIYLCTGGDAPPHHGAHFGDQCRVAAEHGAGIRITNEASNYGRNFFFTHWVASAGRFYGAYFGFEPAGGVDERGITARIYNATVSGARNLHFYEPNILARRETVETWIANINHIAVGEPDEPVALLYPDTSIMLGETDTRVVGRDVAQLRDALNLDFLDDGMIARGALTGYKALIALGSRHVVGTTAEAVRAWVAGGGLLIALGVGRLRTVEDGDITDEFFDRSTGERAIGRGKTLWLPISDAEDSPLPRDVVVRLCAWLTEHGVPLIDGKLDNVYAAHLADRIIFLHHGEETIEKHVTVRDGSASSVTLPPNAIVEIAVENRP